MDLPRLRVEMRCILFCDVVQSTPQIVQARRLGQEEDFAERLVHFVTVFREALYKNGATFFKPLGDGLLATSTEPLGMVRALAEARARLAAESDGPALTVRAGLHVGAVAVQQDGDILGAEAALGARVMGEAHIGQVYVSEACAAQMRPYLPDGYSLREVGERLLQGFDEPTALYELTLPGCASAAHPDPSLTSEPAAETRIRLLLVDDERILRDALASLLELDPQFELVGQASNGAEAVKLAKQTRPDVVLMDIEMPQLDGISATSAIRAVLPETQVCILTKFGDDERLFAAIRAGAIGYMLKDSGVDEIGPVVRAVQCKDGFLSPALVPRVMAEFKRISAVNEQAKSLFADLTRREKEILELMKSGLRNRTIAERLFISDKTVKNHVTNILEKLHVNDRTEAALLARDGAGRIA